MTRTPAHVTDMTAADLARLNSATQYPSIPTYHLLGDRGRLTDERTADFAQRPGDVEITEKIDGTNARLIIPPRGSGCALVGSRTELLTYADDLVPNRAFGIVDTVRHLLDPVRDALAWDAWTVVFGEVYGDGVEGGKASRNYTARGSGKTAFAVFDLAQFDPDVLEWDRPRIATWRDGFGQRFASTDMLSLAAASVEPNLPVVPYVTAPPPPATVAETHAWLCQTIELTGAGLDADRPRPAEGVVVRTTDRAQIAKVRFEDYERTARMAGAP